MTDESTIHVPEPFTDEEGNRIHFTEVNGRVVKFINGKLAPGQAAFNKAGRPKKYKPQEISDEDREFFKNSPLKAMLHLMNNAQNEKDLLTYAKAAAPYTHSKLTSIRQISEEERTIVITFEDPTIQGSKMVASEQQMLEHDESKVIDVPHFDMDAEDRMALEEKVVGTLKKKRGRPKKEE